VPFVQSFSSPEKVPQGLKPSSARQYGPTEVVP
jgi:hypothetical protein